MICPLRVNVRKLKKNSGLTFFLQLIYLFSIRNVRLATLADENQKIQGVHFYEIPKNILSTKTGYLSSELNNGFNRIYDCAVMVTGR